MKRIVLCFMCFTSLWVSIPKVAAQESQSFEQSLEVEHPILTQDSEPATGKTFSVNKMNEEITGVFGTVPWTFEGEKRTLTLDGGEFPETYENNTIHSIIEKNSLSTGMTISKIIFTEPIKANSNSSYLFANLNALETIKNINYLDTRNVTNMGWMFSDAESLTSLDLANWDTRNVTNMSGMFSFASSLTSLDLANWDTRNVTNMSGMFSFASSLTSLDLANWDTRNVTDMGWMFSDASSLTSLDLANWDTRNVTDMKGMFLSVDQLDTLKVGTKTLFKDYTSLPEKKDSTYTGAWKLQNSNQIYSSSQAFLDNYNGTYPGTYVRERTAKDIKITGIELLPTSLSLLVGQEQVVQTKISPIDATNQAVSYTSSDPSIATVDASEKVTAIKAGTATITATTEKGGLTANTQVTVNNPSLVVPDIFYLGIDQYVTGYVDPSLKARKAQLLVNGTVVNTVNLFSDESFELDSNGVITESTDSVEVIVLDKKNGVLDQEKVTIKEKNYSLTVNPYTLYSGAVTGVADYYHSHVSLFVNGELVVNQALSLTREFSLDATDWIDYMDDEVEIIGYRYGVEITRQAVTIELPKIDTTLNDYKVGDLYVTGQITGDQAKQVVLYVNRCRQQVLPLTAGGPFQLSGLSIMSPLDTVQVAVLNGAGIELQRYTVNVSF